MTTPDRPAADELVTLPIDLTTEPGLWPEWMYRPQGINTDGLPQVESLANLRLVEPVERRQARRVKSSPPRCDRCGKPLAVRARKGTRFCSTRCRVAAHRNKIPVELRERPRWVRHTAAKVPLTADGRAASSTDPTTWSTYEQVQHHQRKGLVLNGDGLVCIDLDHCLVDGRPTGRAAEILAALPDTYIEVSPSGDGLHVWGYARVGAGRKLPGGVEVYGTGRYITITGKRFGRCTRLADIGVVVEQLT
ncbi:hypothetical protein JOF41_007365 [Saccharothrix coeruleofusca]|uniref:bifunctional DNA primase/polymerase n=1 Tax=Saccharothrix coeruleofusca TaxID=33919 RepID=UPI001FD27B1A|nr:bifunctional DNA primase/polymerase [Saccharothrix coeruleofusca]MBP2341111.1 hypothetical protein [Saccharothrix coeruleofusca]